MGERERLWARAGICVLGWALGLGARAEGPGAARVAREIQGAYQAQDWDKVFGLSFYYRLKFVGADPTPLALELTALLRHCQQETALELIQIHRTAFAKTEGTLVTRLREDLDRLAEIAQLKVNKASGHGNERGWPLRGSAELQKKIETLSQPLLLRMKVRNLCGA